MSAEQALRIDWTACEGRGLCADLLPELLEPDPWGYPQPRPGAARTAPGTLAVVPDRLVPHARRAVHICPRLALRLSE
jgi:ferredoxin